MKIDGWEIRTHRRRACRSRLGLRWRPATARQACPTHGWFAETTNKISSGLGKEAGCLRCGVVHESRAAALAVSTTPHHGSRRCLSVGPSIRRRRLRCTGPRRPARGWDARGVSLQRSTSGVKEQPSENGRLQAVVLTAKSLAFPRPVVPQILARLKAPPVPQKNRWNFSQTPAII